METFYKTIEQSAQAEYKDRGSRFIAYAFPVASPAEFKVRLKELKIEHPKANHHCFAYRIGLDGNSFRVSDDGEPSGSAGRPILGQIDSKELTGVAIVVVRYFGGTLLGVPGLINAYKTTASLVLQVIPEVQKPILAYYTLDFNYPQLNDIMIVVKQQKCEVIKQELQLFCSMQLGIPLANEAEVIYRLNNLEGITLEKQKK